MYGERFQRRIGNLDMEQVLTAPRSPWHNASVERVIGSIRRECLDHVLVVREGPLRRVLVGSFLDYHRWRTHWSLAMDSPDGRPVQPSDQGAVVVFPDVGGLPHHYARVAA